MHLLSAENLSKQFDERQLFHGVSFSLQRGERVGLIGVNGSGKSTLLRIIAGAETSDTGRVSISKDARIAYLAQNPQMDPARTVLEHVFASDNPRMQLVREYEQASAAVQATPGDAALMEQLGELQSAMDTSGAWDVERHAHTILQQLGITQLTARLGELSGGQRRRVAMAAALIDPADLLILDEPTNHLDADTVAWLETELSRTSAALLLVTHDRYFLDRVVRRTLALEQGQLTDTAGGYSEYLRRRAERMQALATEDQRRSSIMRVELAWMMQGAPARSTKQKARIQRFEALRDAPAAKATDTMSITVPPAQRLGKRVIELKHVAKQFDGRPVISDLTLTLERYERLGIVGPNASGKTTLLNLLDERLQPDSGTLVRGETVRLAYYDQEATALRLDQRVIDYLEDAAQVVRTTDGTEASATHLLERFLFDSKAQYAPISTLSGGERRRLYLLRLLVMGPNVLLLDEPTNDLDIETLAILEDYLDEWPGTLVVASHDRYFLDRTVDHLLVFEGGAIKTFPGSYSAYADARAAQLKAKAPGKGSAKPAPTASASVAAAPPAAKLRKSSFKEQREVERLEQQLERLETEQAELNSKLAAGGDYKQLEVWASRLVVLGEELEFNLAALGRAERAGRQLAQRPQRDRQRRLGIDLV